MTHRAYWLDPLAVLVVFAALVAWILGAGWWSPFVGTILIAFGPGYLLLRGAAHTVSGTLVRMGLYVGASLAISALVGLGLALAGLPLTYESLASTYLVIVALLFVAQEVVTMRRVKVVRSGAPSPQFNALTFAKGSLLVALPFAGAVFLLATSPVRNAEPHELYFAPIDGQISDLPTTFLRTAPIEFRVVARLGTPAATGVLQIFAADQLVSSWDISAGADVDKLVSFDAAEVPATPLRIEARLRSPGRPDVLVWLNLAESTHEGTTRQ